MKQVRAGRAVRVVAAGARRLLGRIRGEEATKQANDRAIGDAFRRLVNREPNPDELAHWNVYLGNGVGLGALERSLRASFEYIDIAGRRDVVLVTLPSFAIYCRSSDLDVGNGIIKNKIHEPHVTALVKDLLHSGDTFLDLGANIGWFTLLAATLVGERGKVLAFEPNALNLRLLHASVVQNRFTRVIVYALGASDAPKILKLQSFGSNGFLAPPTAGELGDQYVQTVVLDEILSGEARINVVKMDIEGYEPLALRGMKKTIEKHRPALITEFSPYHLTHRAGIAPIEYLQQWVGLGYRFSVIERSGHLTQADGPEDVMKAWRAAGNDKLQLDLFAKPG